MAAQWPSYLACEAARLTVWQRVAPECRYLGTGEAPSRGGGNPGLEVVDCGNRRLSGGQFGSGPDGADAGNP